MKNVWFVSHYSMPPQFEMRIKTQKFAEHLNNKEYRTLIFSSSALHNTKINLIEGRKPFIRRTYGTLDFIHIRCRQYSRNGLQRLVNMLEFGFRFGRIASRFDKPDIVVADTNCIAFGPIWSFCKKNNVKFVVDVRDLWPLSLIELGVFPVNKMPLIAKYLFRREKKMYAIADALVFSMERGKEYISERGWAENQGGPVSLDKVFHINNGVDLDEFSTLQRNNTIVDSDLDDDSTFKVVYTGSISYANNMGIVIDAARILQGAPIKFLIWGEGTELDALKKRCLYYSLNNVVFKGKIEKRYVPAVLSKSDLNFFTLKDSDLYRFGLSLNKSFEYLASGKPMLILGKAGHSLVEEYDCGMHVHKTDPSAFAEAVTRISSLSEERYSELCQNALRAAKDFDYGQLAKKFEMIIEGLEI